MEPTTEKPRPNQVTGARITPKTDELLIIGRLRSTALRLEIGQSVEVKYPTEYVEASIRDWLTKAKHHVEIAQGDRPGLTKITKTNAPAKRQPGQKGRAKSNESIEYRLMTLKPGERINLAGANYFSVSAVASAIKSRGQAAFRVTQSASGETLVERTSGVLITRRDGTQREADPKTLRGEYPFRAMEDGDAYTVDALDHKGIHAMTLHCRRYQKLRGWAFTPTLHSNGTITIQCHVQGTKPGPIPLSALKD